MRRRGRWAQLGYDVVIWPIAIAGYYAGRALEWVDATDQRLRAWWRSKRSGR